MDEVTQTRVFLSYSRKNFGLVNELYEKLKRMGFSPWQDHRDIAGGQKWIDAIIKAIQESSFFVVCLSNDSVERQTGILVREINEALEMLSYKRKGHIYIIPVRLEKCSVPEELAEHQWIDLFEPDGFDRLVKSLRHGLRQLGISGPLHLRSQPLESLTPAEAGNMIKERDFYSYFHWQGQGIHHEYEPQTINDNKVVIDHTTGLMWQQSGFSVVHKNIHAYIGKLNAQKYAGFLDWRLPTLEEALSLMEPERNDKEGLRINPLFDTQQQHLWTADKEVPHRAWAIDFGVGSCVLGVVSSSFFVRVVRNIG